MWYQLPETEYIDDPIRMEQVAREVRAHRRAAVDTETTGVDRQKDLVVMWSICPHPGVRYACSPEMLKVLKGELIDDPRIEWDFTNAPFDLSMLENMGVPVPAGPVHCTLIMDWLWDENRRGRHGLKETAWDHLKLNMDELSTVVKKQRGESVPDAFARLMREDFASAIDYASKDAWGTQAVHDNLMLKLRDVETDTGLSLLDLYLKVEVPYTKMLHIMARRGVRVAPSYLEDLRGPMQQELDKVAREFARAAGREINLNSPKQLRDLFFGELGWDPIKWTKGGESGNRQPSCDEDTLKLYAAQGKPLAQVLMKHRGIAKIKGTYVDGLLKHVGREDRIYTNIKQHGTVTTRLSSVSPNLTNIPNPEDDIYRIRDAFIARDGHRLMAADYKQLEMYLLAHLSGDVRMQEVIHKGWDVHMGNAAITYGVPYEDIVAAKKEAGRLEAADVPHDQWPEEVTQLLRYRRNAKGVGFAVTYGEGDAALAEQLGVTKQEAADTKEELFDQYPGLRDFIFDTHDDVVARGQVSNLLGYIRHLPEAQSDWKGGYWTKSGRYVQKRPGPWAARALRQSVNLRVQGTAAAVVRLAQMFIEGIDGYENEHADRLRELGYEQILQIHDEVLAEYPTEKGIEAEIEKPLRAIMEHPFHDLPERLGLNFRELDVPLRIDIGTGDTWAQAH